MFKQGAYICQEQFRQTLELIFQVDEVLHKGVVLRCKPFLKPMYLGGCGNGVWGASMFYLCTKEASEQIGSIRGVPVLDEFVEIPEEEAMAYLLACIS